MSNEPVVMDEERFERFLEKQGIKFHKTNGKYILEKPIRMAIDETEDLTKRPIKLALGGKAGCGKTTIATQLEKKYGFERYSFAKRIKEICNELFPEQMKQSKEKKRWIFQQFGTEYCRSIKNNVWIDIVIRTIEKSRSPRIVIDDLRFKNEVLVLKEHGFTLGHIWMPEERRKKFGYNVHDQHPSETELDDWGDKFDITIVNNYDYPFKLAAATILRYFGVPY